MLKVYATLGSIQNQGPERLHFVTLTAVNMSEAEALVIEIQQEVPEAPACPEVMILQAHQLLGRLPHVFCHWHIEGPCKWHVSNALTSCAPSCLGLVTTRCGQHQEHATSLHLYLAYLLARWPQYWCRPNEAWRKMKILELLQGSTRERRRDGREAEGGDCSPGRQPVKPGAGRM